MTLPTRTWGDGAMDARSHVIVDLSYAEGWVICRCGITLVGHMPTAWRQHGGAVLGLTNAADRGVAHWVEPNEDRARRAFDLIAQRAANCTCETTSVEECPNYIPGDEDPDHDE